MKVLSGSMIDPPVLPLANVNDGIDVLTQLNAYKFGTRHPLTEIEMLNAGFNSITERTDCWSSAVML